MNLVFSSKFEQDFAELVERFATESSVSLATGFEDNTCRLIETIQQYPGIGRLRKDLSPAGIRSFRVPGFERYLLFYRVQGEDVAMLRLRFGGMNLQALFKNVT